MAKGFKIKINRADLLKYPEERIARDKATQKLEEADRKPFRFEFNMSDLLKNPGQRKASEDLAKEMEQYRNNRDRTINELVHGNVTRASDQLRKS